MEGYRKWRVERGGCVGKGVRNVVGVKGGGRLCGPIDNEDGCLKVSLKGCDESCDRRRHRWIAWNTFFLSPNGVRTQALLS